MEESFGRDAGPRAVSHGSVPAFGSSASPPSHIEPVLGNYTSVTSQAINSRKSEMTIRKVVPSANLKRPSTQFLPENIYQSAPRQNLSPPSRHDIHSRLTSSTNSKEVATDAQTGSTTRTFLRPVSPSVPQTSYSNAHTPKRNRSPVPQHSLGSQSAFQAPAGELSKRMRSPIDEIPRSDKPSKTEMYNQYTLWKSRPPPLEPDFSPGSAFQINVGRRPVSYTDSIFDGNSDEPPKGSQMPSPKIQRPVSPSKIQTTYQAVPGHDRNRLCAPNQHLASRSAFLAPKRPFMNSDMLFDSAGESSKQFRSPIREVARSDEPSEIETHCQNTPQMNRSSSPKHDFLAGTTSQINTRRKPVTYTDSIFDETSVEPSKGNQPLKGNQFLPPAAQRGNVLPQNSHKKGAALQKSGKLSDLKALTSPLHTVDSTAPQQILSAREEEAKARRLARFGAELSQPDVELAEPPASNAESSRQQADIDISEATTIIGLCPDMCPESERGERERKGDLDKHERLDGDRNQTTRFLAVKKYSRTADRDPDLIRPLPVLMKSMDYLLQLLDRPYDDDFLGFYNFLWDRMRAVRMDLRMQHIFNLEAISMLEQMIRLHIIAMHELCEYNKGEGFSEGFDAHLNIEQMNKASVELFQMYEDHRRKGIVVPTEREFRGYYALLKLDKHPGYKVEPAELSMDLAKMSPEVRCSPEITFARNVAKACRVGNYVSFFRLAKKATYLQACLMHAHFSKLRTEALASLHSSFQSNQGMPLAQLEGMLAMEGEDIESFVEQHGLALKFFEEIYIVKDGPFFRGDLPSKRSPTVGKKRSDKIKIDVCFSPVSNATLNEKVSDLLKVAGTKRTSDIADVIMSDSPRPVKVSDQSQLALQPISEPEEADQLTAAISAKLIDAPVLPLLPIQSLLVSTGVAPVMDTSNAQSFVLSKLPAPVSPASSSIAAVRGTSNTVASSDQDDPSIRENEVQAMLVQKKLPENGEISKEKLKLILRKWRQKAMELRLRREKQEEREALMHKALESLSVGPLLRTSVDNASKKETELLNMDRAIQARLRKQEKSWSVLNISELVTPILAEQNPDARCLCWKLVLSLPAGSSSVLPAKWLLTKFNFQEAGSSVSIFKLWSGPQLSLSFVRADQTGSFEKDSVSGASCILFLVSGNSPLETHKDRLHNLSNRIPAGSNLPLLVVIGNGLNGEEETTIIAKLGLPDIEQTTFKVISVIFLNQDLQNELPSNGLFDDRRLREGVRWLAEHSPLQSEVSLVNTRTVLLSYSKPKLEALNDAYDEVGPDQCISAVNESIDWLISAVLGSAKANPNFWPCPETNLLDKSSCERYYAEMTLPKAAWSEPQKIKAQIDALSRCKLPCFRFDLSWLCQGSNYTDKKHVQDQKVALEECLFNYLSLQTQSHEAMEEAWDLVQRCTSLVLRDSCFYLVPRWTAIFCQIFNTRLLTVAKEASDVYVSEDIGKMQYFNVHRRDLLVSNELSYLPLDEKIESSFALAGSTARPIIPAMSDVHPEVHEETQADEESGMVQQVYEVPDNVGLPVKKEKQSQSVVQGRYAFLLEQCTKVQDEIDKKLYVYF